MSDITRNPMHSSPYRIETVRQETHDTFTLELVSANGSDGVSFAPGQFNMLYIFGAGEIPISISGDPTSHERLVHTTREVGAVTHAMRQLRRGDMIGVRGPYGTSWPIKEAEGKDIVIVTGGIGLAPLRPALYGLISERQKYGKIVLLYGARTPDEILYQRELAQWRAKFDLEVYVTVDRAMGGWRGNVGVVTTLIPKAPFDPSSTLAFVCGPEIMMRYTVLELNKRGVHGENIHISMERNMKCGIGFCGHCQFGGVFVCKDGPVFRYDQVRDLVEKREV
ncbi:MAG: FAD/NAD(P)-binding protein [Anaerolineae bacterium]